MKFKDLIKISEKKTVDLPIVEIQEAIISHDINAHQIAKQAYGKDYSNAQFVLAKISCCCKFNGGLWNIKQIEDLPTEFINAIVEKMNEVNEENEKN